MSAAPESDFAHAAVVSAAATVRRWPAAETMVPAVTYVPPRRVGTGRRELVGRVPPALSGPSTIEALEAIDAFNEKLAAFTYVDRDPRGVGPVLSVKDVIHVAGMPTRAGSAAYERHPDRDASSVGLFRKAGFRIIGKTETHELALGVTTPQARHPLDSSRLAGGSSGGAAIAPATGMCAVSLGTDTRASIRVPAALCGVVGFKPTFGTVPTDGIVTLSWTMDHVAPMALTVGDVAQALDVLTGAGSARAWRAPIDGLRLGVVRAGFEGCEEPVTVACHTALDALRDRGVELVDAPILDAEALELANQAGLVVSRTEAATFHEFLGTDTGRLTAETAGQLRAAASVGGVEYLQAQRARAHLADRLLGESETLDLDGWVMPTVPVVAPAAEDADKYLTVLSRNAIPWSFTGFPAASVPAPVSSGDLPVGLQITAPPFEDRTLVAVASALEASVV